MDSSCILGALDVYDMLDRPMWSVLYGKVTVKTSIRKSCGLARGIRNQRYDFQKEYRSHRTSDAFRCNLPCSTQICGRSQHVIMRLIACYWPVLHFSQIFKFELDRADSYLVAGW